MLFVGSSYAQTIPSNTENYIYSKTYLSDPALLNPKSVETIQYFDGLGRLKQIVNVKASPMGKDVVSHIEYDNFGRQTKDFLPVPQQTTQNGAIFPTPLSNVASIYGTEKIYAERILESSPLNRTQEKIQVGNDWSTKPVKYNYDVNINGEVKKYIAATLWNNDITVSSISISGTYGNAQLYKNRVKDEDGNETIVFKNLLGQIILIRKNNGAQNIDTYYVYNEYDHLTYVIPPLASIAPDLNQTILDNLCYQYRYDRKRRLIEKKLPGKDWEYKVYDKQDRLVATQDANLKAKGQWLYTKYDQFGRVAITGISTGYDRSTEQNIVDGLGANNVNRLSTAPFERQGMPVYYGNQDITYPDSTKWVTILSLNYYDTYPSYNFNPPFPNTIINQPSLTDNSTGNNVSTKSFPVLSLVKNIEDDNWTKDYVYYNYKGQTIGTHSINHLGGYTHTESKLDFIGVPQQTITRHKRLNSDTEKVITETFEYDHQNRLIVHKHKVDNNTEEILAQNNYNEISQITNKKVGGIVASNPLQSIDYTYNIRGWLTKINDPENLGGKLFGYAMKYNDPAIPSTSTPQYGGNIAEVHWKTANDGVYKVYNYIYDKLNRLTAAIYREPYSTVPDNNFYNEGVSYDLNGNILTLKRNRNAANVGAQQIDNLIYNYSGNKLNSVTDSSSNYFGYPDVSSNLINYDSNGNMTNHIDKGILQIDYNFLNLPDYIKFDQYVMREDPLRIGLEAKYKNTTYLYRADGIKLKKVHNYFSGRTQVNVAKITEYLDGFQYNYDINGLGTPIESQGLQFLPTSEGYFDFSQNRYIYQYKDQVGNVRLAFYKDDNGSTVVDRVTDFYPFGLAFGGENGLNTFGTISPNYTYAFQEQEKQQDTGWYSFKWRNYDPSMARFFGIDPLSEMYAYQSHYNFSENRVIDARELEGLEMSKVNPDPYSPASFGGMPYDGGVDSNITWSDGLKGSSITEVMLQGQSSESPSASSFGMGDAARLGIGFVPFVGSGLDIYEGARDGNWVQFGFGIGGMAIDIATMGAGSLVKGSIKTIGTRLVEEGVEKAAKEAAETEFKILSKSEMSTIVGAGSDTNVVRGGTCLACQFENGSGVAIDADGLLHGVSVNSAEGLSIKELSTGIPNGKIGTTTVSQIEALGGKVKASPTKNNPYHSTLSGITAEQAEKLFNPTIKNPTK